MTVEAQVSTYLAASARARGTGALGVVALRAAHCDCGVERLGWIKVETVRI